MQKKLNVEVILFCIIILLTFHRWLIFGSIITSGDWPFFFKETLANVRIWYLSSWLDDANLGRILFDIAQGPTYLLHGLLAKFFNFDYILTSRIIHLYPIIGLILVTPFVLLKHLFTLRSSIVFALIYFFNTYFLTLITGHITLAVAYAFLPVIITYWIVSTKKNGGKYFFIALILTITQGFFEPRTMMLTVGLIVLASVYEMSFVSKDTPVKSLTRLAFFILLLILSNTFWIISLFNKELAGPLSELGTRSIFGAEFFTLTHAISLHHPYWSNGLIQVFDKSAVPLNAYLLIIFIAYSLSKNRKNTNFAFWTTIFLLGVFLVKSTNPPFGDFVNTLFKYIPVLGLYRDTSKFYLYISVAIAFLSAYSLENLSSKIKYFKLFIVSLIFFLSFYRTQTFMNGQIGTTFQARTIPHDYISLKEQLKQDIDFFRTYWIPRESRWTYYDMDKRFLGDIYMRPLLHEISKNININSITELNTMSNVLKLWSVKYVLVPVEDNQNDDNFFVHYQNRNTYVEMIRDTKQLEEISSGQSGLAIFKTEYHMPHIYVTDILPSSKYISPNHTELNSTQISPNTYSLNLKLGTDNLVLMFSESYNSNWKIRIGDFNWVDSLADKNYFYPDKYHKKLDVGLNAWQIDLNWFAERGYQVDEIVPITLYFAPQAWMNLGLIISGSTFIIILGFLVYFTIKKYEKK
jgi:hypothetical protein